MHPDVADDYREARRIRADIVARAGGTREGDPEEDTTEELRQTIRKYRAVYQRLVRGYGGPGRHFTAFFLGWLAQGVLPGGGCVE
jgi:hypothetical protein